MLTYSSHVMACIIRSTAHYSEESTESEGQEGRSWLIELENNKGRDMHR